MMQQSPRQLRAEEKRNGQEMPLGNLGNGVPRNGMDSSVGGHDISETKPDADNDSKTYKEAIRESDFECLRRLLEEGVPIVDNLFYAISHGSLNAVKIICNYYQSKESPDELKQIVNRFPQESDFLPTATPLQIAAKSNDYQIIKVLLGHGAVMPTLEDCLERAGSDMIVRSLVFLLHTKALCSPALLVAKETNPVGEALRLVQHLDDNIFIRETHGWFVNHQSFRDCLAEIRQTLEDFLCSILDSCKNRSEVDTILAIEANHKLDDGTGDPDNVPPEIKKDTREDSALPLGMMEAISLGFKKYVTHPFAQSVLMERAFEGPVCWDSMSTLRFSILSMMLVVVSPFLCLTYALLPIPILVRFIKTPYVRILNTFSSHLFFMTFLFLSTVNLSYFPVEGEIPNSIIPMGNFTGQIVEHRFWSTTRRMMIIGFIILGEIIWLVYHLYRIGIRTFVRQVWNWINIIQTAFFAASLCCYILSVYATTKAVNENYGDPSTSPEDRFIPTHTTNGTHLFESSRSTWAPFDRTLVAELTFAIANSLTVLRLLYTFTLLDFLGPLVISMSRIFLTIGRFLVISVLLIVSFALGLSQLFAPYHALSPCTEEDDVHSLCGNTSAFSSLEASILTLFWTVFGSFDIKTLHLPPNLQMITDSGHIMHAIFMILMTVAIMNMLIATIISVYEGIHGNIDTEWKFARTKMLEEHIGKRVNLPPPYNLVPSVRFIVNSIRNVFRWFYKRAEYLTTDRAIRSQRYHRPSKEGKDTLEAGIYKEEHKILMIVVGRFVDEAFSSEQDDSTHEQPEDTNARRRSTVFHNYANGKSSIQSKRKASSLGPSFSPTSFKPIAEHNGVTENLTVPRDEPSISLT